MNIINEKRCGGCGEVKPHEDFSKCRKRKDGLQPKCKACNKKDNTLFRKTKPQYWSYENGYFSDKEKWEYISLYQKADKSIKIYMISFDDGTKYIGSTKALLNVRLNRHIIDYKRKLNNDNKRLLPLLHEKFDEFNSIDDIVKHIKENTVIIDECNGSKTKQYRLEALWIVKLLKQGERLLNKTIPQRYQKLQA